MANVTGSEQGRNCLYFWANLPRASLAPPQARGTQAIMAIGVDETPSPEVRVRSHLSHTCFAPAILPCWPRWPVCRLACVALCPGPIGCFLLWAAGHVPLPSPAWPLPSFFDSIPSCAVHTLHRCSVPCQKLTCWPPCSPFRRPAVHTHTHTTTTVTNHHAHTCTQHRALHATHAGGGCHHPDRWRPGGDHLLREARVVNRWPDLAGRPPHLNPPPAPATPPYRRPAP